jgi:hypothetical protein
MRGPKGDSRLRRRVAKLISHTMRGDLVDVHFMYTSSYVLALIHSIIWLSEHPEDYEPFLDRTRNLLFSWVRWKLKKLNLTTTAKAGKTSD